MSETKRDRRDERESQHTISIRRGVAILLAIVLVATTALATFALTRLTSRSGAMNQPEAPVPTAEPVEMRVSNVPAPKPDARAIARDELQLQMSANGFTPSEVTRAAGAFAITVENVGVEGELVLQLKDQSGTTLREVRVQKGSASWTVELATGSYTLVEANHPDWVCHITVQ